MPQVYVVQSPGTRFPFRVRDINTAYTSLVVVSIVTYTVIAVTFTPGGTTGLGQSIYDNAVTVDTTSFSWLVMAQKGSNYPVLMKEMDFPSQADTLLGASWAILARIADGQVYKLPQI